MTDDTILRLECIDSYTDIPFSTQKIVFPYYKDEYYSKLKIPFGCKLYEKDKEITLLYACSRNLTKTALQIILNNEILDVGSVDEKHCTALMYSCKNKMYDVALLLINTFGVKCNPQQVDDDGYTALMYACLWSMSDIALLLINTFGLKCNPHQFSPYESNALYWTIVNKMNDVALLFINTFGVKCNPHKIKVHSCNILQLASKNKMYDVSSLLLDFLAGKGNKQ
jgi:ankyrin repeat protein